MIEVQSEERILEIRGKMLVAAATQKELHFFLAYVSALESLVEEASMEDFYGTEGYRKCLGWETES